MRIRLSFGLKRNGLAKARGRGRAASRAAGLLLGCSILGTGAAADADPLTAPAFTAPLAANPNPVGFDGGPFGQVFVTGQVTGLGLVQSHTQPAPGTGNAASLFDLDNAQVEIQTATGPVQFYLQAGAYSLPALGTPYLRTGRAVDQDFGALPVAYVKFVPTPEISVRVGALPTLMTLDADAIDRMIDVNVRAATSHDSLSHAPCSKRRPCLRLATVFVPSLDVQVLEKQSSRISALSAARQPPRRSKSPRGV